MKLNILNKQLAAVKEYGLAIKYIKNPCLEVQLAAVKQNGNAIKHIKKPCLEVQLAAVKLCGAIKYIKKPCLEVQLAAVKEFENLGNIIGNVVQYINQCITKPYPEVQKIYFLSCLKENKEFDYDYIKDLDLVWIKNMIDCKDILE